MDCLRLSFTPGVILGGRYQTISPLNHGSFGMVFMAKDLQANRTVAIKCLTKQSAADEAGLDLAIDEKSEELILQSRISSHPNIVNLLDSFETDAHVYLVLEFCANGDLYEAIRQGHGPLETEHVRQFMLELVDAVSYIHAKGIYHRDIKPENIFLAQSGSMKLGDFGLATTEKWTFETTVGSDRYMSPEQYDSAGAGYSPAQADIWAVGICLLNVLFSRNPFSTPTEADPIFLDFSRDKQSLFDVFPTMSQDTYEVIVQCMNMDPTKRSLEGARDALERAISFTTLDEALDEFCCTDRRVIATANREPLRTPSIQSPQVDTGAFPWAKALQATSPQLIRQLSVIQDIDNESYTEELFSKSEATTDWISAAAQTPSMSSILDSSFGASMKSLNILEPPQINGRTRARAVPMAGSLPINMSKPRNHLSAMSLVFGRRDAMSKSWSDMWDEDVEEAEEERTQKIQALKEINSRTWSHESKANDDTPRGGLSPATKSSVLAAPTEDVPSIDSAISNDIDGEMVADGFFFQEAPAAMQTSPVTPARYSPPSKRGSLDKWAALGERRRAYTGSGSTMAPSEKTSLAAYLSNSSSGNHIGNHVSGQKQGVSQQSSSLDHLNYTAPHAYSFNNYPGFTHYHHPNHGKHSTNNNKDRAKECPRPKGRDRDWNLNLNWRREKRHDFGDVEWVGGWSEAPVSS